MIKIRNTSYKPDLKKEGTLIRPLPCPPKPVEHGIWFKNLKTHERLYFHQTMNSVRRCKRYLPNPNIPRDSLDFQLQARYYNGKEFFPDKIDFVLQNETCSVDTFRVLRNTKDIVIPKPFALGHPLRIAGLKEKVSPHSVKLINSGHRTQLTNNGFSRQPADGNFFHY